jgi:hypothetical protein
MYTLPPHWFIFLIVVTRKILWFNKTSVTFPTRIIEILLPRNGKDDKNPFYKKKYQIIPGNHRCNIMYTLLYFAHFITGFPHSWLISGFVTRLTRRVPLVEQELPTLPEHLSSPPVFSGLRVTRSLVLCECFVDRCFYFRHCFVCSFSIYGFWLPLWYL